MPLLLLIEECPEQLPFGEVAERPSLTFRDDSRLIHPYYSGRGNQLRIKRHPIAS